MKKLIKSVLVLSAALILFLNVSIQLKTNNAVVLDLKSETAQAWDGICYYLVYQMECYCKTEYYPCGGLCPNGATGNLCEGS